MAWNYAYEFKVDKNRMCSNSAYEPSGLKT